MAVDGHGDGGRGMKAIRLHRQLEVSGEPGEIFNKGPVWSEVLARCVPSSTLDTGLKFSE